MKFSTPHFYNGAWQNDVVSRGNLAARLERGADMLTLIRRIREETGCQSLGENIERLVIERELSELDSAI